MNDKVITRREYMTDSARLFQAYYLQFSVIKSLRDFVESVYTKDEIRMFYSEDKYLNNLPRNKNTSFDNWTRQNSREIATVNKKIGNGAVYSLCDGTCAIKAYMREWAKVDETEEKREGKRMILFDMKIQFTAREEVEAHTVTNPRELVGDLHRAFNEYPQQEQFRIVCLDGANRPLGQNLVTLGLVNQTQIHPRECFRPAILAGAVSVIIAHNHPSGTLSPSSEDLQITRRLVDCGHMLDIPVLDHLILAESGWVSIKATHGFLFSKKEG